MIVGDIIKKTQLALKRTQHETIKMQYEDILELLIELRDKVEDFNSQAWRHCDHESFSEYVKLAGHAEEIEAEEDIVEFLERYESDLNYCVSRSYPTERERRLAEGWDPKP